VNWFGRVAAQFPTVYLEPMGWLPVFDARRHPVQGRVLSPAERAALYSAIKREAIPPERLLLDGSLPMGGV